MTEEPGPKRSAPFPVGWSVLGGRTRKSALRHAARPIGWPPATRERARAVLSEASRVVCIMLVAALLALAVLLLAVHVQIHGVQGVRILDQSGGCGRGDVGFPTRSELDGAPSPIGPAFTC